MWSRPAIYPGPTPVHDVERTSGDIREGEDGETGQLRSTRVDGGRGQSKARARRQLNSPSRREAELIPGSDTVSASSAG